METITTTQELTTLDRFAPFEAQAKEWMAKAVLIKVTDVNQVELIKGAKEARLALRRIRIDIENTRVELKEEYLRKGNEIQSIANRLKVLIEPIEAHLKEQEDFEEIQAAKIKKELFDERLAKLRPVMGKEAELMPLAEMTNMAFNNMLNGAKLAKEQSEREAIEAEEARLKAKLEEERQAEFIKRENFLLKRLNDRVAKLSKYSSNIHYDGKDRTIVIDDLASGEKTTIYYGELHDCPDERFERILEGFRLVSESNFKLNAKKAEREQAEKNKVQAKLDKERDERREAEKKLKDKLQQEENEKKEAAAAARKAKRAPDKVKLLTLAEQIELLPVPELKEEEAKGILIATQGLLAKVIKYLKDKSETL